MGQRREQAGSGLLFAGSTAILMVILAADFVCDLRRKSSKALWIFVEYDPLPISFSTACLLLGVISARVLFAPIDRHAVVLQLDRDRSFVLLSKVQDVAL